MRDSVGSEVIQMNYGRSWTGKKKPSQHQARRMINFWKPDPTNLRKCCIFSTILEFSPNRSSIGCSRCREVPEDGKHPVKQEWTQVSEEIQLWSVKTVSKVSLMIFFNWWFWISSSGGVEIFVSASGGENFCWNGPSCYAMVIGNSFEPPGKPGCAPGRKRRRFWTFFGAKFNVAFCSILVHCRNFSKSRVEPSFRWGPNRRKTKFEANRPITAILESFGNKRKILHFWRKIAIYVLRTYVIFYGSVNPTPDQRGLFMGSLRWCGRPESYVYGRFRRFQVRGWIDGFSKKMVIFMGA